MIRTLSVIAGLAVSATAVNAAFLSLVIREDKTLPAVSGAGSNSNPLPPAGMRTFNMYAQFDAAGTASGAGKVNTVLSVGQPNTTAGFGINLSANPGSNFYQATAGQGASASNRGGPDLSFENDRALYDTWVSIGLKYQDSNLGLADNTSGDPDFAFQNKDSISGATSSGLGAGQDFVKGGWNTSDPTALQGAAKDNAGQFLSFLGQFTIAGLAPGAQLGSWSGALQPDQGNSAPGAMAQIFNSNIFQGRLTIFRQGDTGVGEPAAVEIKINFNAIPTPGSMALFGLAGLVVSRRRRA